MTYHTTGIAFTDAAFEAADKHGDGVVESALEHGIPLDSIGTKNVAHEVDNIEWYLGDLFQVMHGVDEDGLHFVDLHEFYVSLYRQPAMIWDERNSIMWHCANDMDGYGPTLHLVNAMGRPLRR